MLSKRDCENPSDTEMAMPVADSEDNQMAHCYMRAALMHANLNSAFFYGTPSEFKVKNHFWKISLKLLIWSWFASKRHQKTRLLNSETSVMSDVIDSARGSVIGAYDPHPKTDSLRNRSLKPK